MTTVEKTSSGGQASLLKFLVGLFLGPIGWLIAMAATDEAPTTTLESLETKTKVKILIPQCVLCREQHKPEVVDEDNEYGKYCFMVHPQFKQRLSH